MVEINESGLRKAMQQIGDHILEVDRRFRAEHAGEDATTLEPLARQAFAGIGVTLTDQDASSYAASVANRTDFEFRLS